MKILHLNTYEKAGGAAIAAHRIHLALNAHTSCESIMGVLHKQSDSDIVYPLPMYTSRVARILGNRISSKLASMVQPNDGTYFSSYIIPNNLLPAIKALKPDLVHLHWIAHFMSPWMVESLAQLGVPVVWTLHDTWAFTGGCHYYGNCEKWQSQCHACPHIAPISLDIINLQWKAKKRAYAATQPVIIALSHFMEESAKKSALCGDLSVNHLVNTINTQDFRPIDKKMAREVLGLEQDKKYILFGANSATKDVRKGYDLLVSALQCLSPDMKESAHCLIFGAAEGAALPISATFLGRLNDSITLALMYSAADVFVCPSREDNLPNTVIESLACATPVVGFAIGGIPDMVEHQSNGYVATPFDTQDLAHGITFVLEDALRHSTLCHAARKKVEENYAEAVVAKQYMALYEKVLAKSC